MHFGNLRKDSEAVSTKNLSGTRELNARATGNLKQHREDDLDAIRTNQLQEREEIEKIADFCRQNQR